VAKAGEDRARAADIYLRSFRLVITVAAPMVIGITVIADLIVAVFLGPKWGPAATVIVALAPVGLLRCMAPLSSAMLSGTGRSGLQFWTSLLTVGLSAIGVAAGIALGGLPGAAAGLGVAM